MCILTVHSQNLQVKLSMSLTAANFIAVWLQPKEGTILIIFREVYLIALWDVNNNLLFHWIAKSSLVYFA